MKKLKLTGKLVSIPLKRVEMDYFEIRYGNPALFHAFMEQEIGKAGGCITVDTVIDEKFDGTFILNVNQLGAYRIGYEFALFQVRIGDI